MKSIRLMKRFTARLLVFLMLLPLRAFSQESASVRFASFVIPSAWGAVTAQLSLDDSWFFSNASDYHHGLARISLAMAVSAFRANDTPRDGPIRSFLGQLGFTEIETSDFEAAGQNTLASALACRPLQGSEATLVAIAVCGGNYGDEWQSNLNIGSSGNHAGFAAAANTVMERLKAFESRHHLTGRPCVYWLSGYGRGGAVCDALAMKMHETGRQARSFSFASPCTAVERIGQCPGAFTILCAADALAAMPPREWGFGRFGRTLYLPSSLDKNNDYPALLPAYSAIFRQFTGQSDWLGDTDLAPMARAAAKEIASQFGDRASYQQQWQKALCKVFTGRIPGPVESLRVLQMMQAVSEATCPRCFLPFLWGRFPARSCPACTPSTTRRYTPPGCCPCPTEIRCF